MGSVYAYSSPPGSSSILDKAPLSGRGWVMQESVLARRTSHFTAYGMVWTCSRDPAMQLGEFHGRGSHLMPNTWVTVIRDYTKRALIYKSDKLVAIQGLANAWARKPDTPTTTASSSKTCRTVWYGLGVLQSITNWSAMLVVVFRPGPGLRLVSLRRC